MEGDAHPKAVQATPEQMIQVKWEDAVQDHIEYVDDNRLCLEYKGESFYFNTFDFRDILHYGTVCFDCAAQTWRANFRYPRFGSIVTKILADTYFTKASAPSS